MRLTELDEKFKIYEVKVASGDSYFLDGKTLQKVLNSPQEFFMLPNGEGFRKSSISNWVIDKEKTRENVIKNKPKLLPNQI